MQQSRTTPLNYILATGLAFVNCVLLYFVIFGYQEIDNPVLFKYLILVIPLQLGLIALYAEPKVKRAYIIATIITLILCLLFLLLIFYLEGLGRAYQH